MGRARRRHGASAPRRHAQPEAADRGRRGRGDRDPGAERVAHPTVPRRGRRRGGRRPAPAPPLRRPASSAHGPQPGAALAGAVGDPQRHGAPWLPRGRDAPAHAPHARGCARLPRAFAHPSARVVRAAAVTAAVQAAADGRRRRALLPDRALLPR